MGRFKVYLRMKPGVSEETDIAEIQDDTTVIIDPRRSGNLKSSTPNRRTTRYTFEKIFAPSCGQQEVFRRVALPSVRNVLSGKPALIFINGAAGSGKTFTMLGTPEEPGILPRTLDVLFNSISPNLQAMKFVFKPDKMNGYDVRLKEDAMIDRQNVLLDSSSRIGQEIATEKESDQEENNERMKQEEKAQGDWVRRDRWRWDHTKIESDIPDNYRVAVFVQFVEIYNNCVFDLLDKKTSDGGDANRGQPWKNIRHDASKCTYVFGATEVEVENADEAMDVFMQGQAMRRASHARLNAERFGSHSIYIIRLVQAPVDEETGEVVQQKEYTSVTQLNLVDLASGDTAAADNSLDFSSMCLRSCLNAVRMNQTKGSNMKVPYRDSRLTHLFKSFFEGHGNIRMLLCVSRRADDYAKTLEVMKFAAATEEGETTGGNKITRRLQFADLSPAASNEDLYTTARDIGSTSKPSKIEEDSLNLNNLRLDEPVFDATIEDKDTVSFSSADALQDEIKNVVSRAAAQEEKYRMKSRILEETLVQLNQIKREKNYFKQRLSEVEAEKESLESQLSTAEETLRKIRKQKLRMQDEIESLRLERPKRRSSHQRRSVDKKSPRNSNNNNNNNGVTTSPSIHDGTIDEFMATHSETVPERPQRRKQRSRTYQKFEVESSGTSVRSPMVSFSSESESCGPRTLADSTEEETSKNSTPLTRSDGDSSSERHLNLMETKERCKIAIEGHPYTRKLVFRKRDRRSFRLKDFFGYSKK